MATQAPILVTGAGGGTGGVGRGVVALLRERDLPVRALLHREDERAEAVRALGAEVVIGDLTRPDDVARALDGAGRMFFSMTVSPDYLEATTVVATVARELDSLEALVSISQMTVSQMTTTSTEESHQQRLHFLSEQVLNWSGLPVVHVRPTMFMDNPLLTTLAARSIAADGTLLMPFGDGRTSPVAASDVARVIATILLEPGRHVGRVYELTGPTCQDMKGIAEEYSRALGRAVSYVDIPADQWLERIVRPVGLPPHVEEHIVTMARLHRANRYDRATRTIEEITGVPAQTVEQFVTEHAALFSPAG
ncbi:MAG TPA: NAD(P)H-binding protein [Pseudonocardia sp.]|jgi:uncharacterized protein YbjT (DUF2867 family)|uniref:NmrA family NAD(P)-binding protein n=1 Tax=Pseudonocardia sp. TaxID=60912 RepID=UPI002EDB9CC6